MSRAARAMDCERQIQCNAWAGSARLTRSEIFLRMKWNSCSTAFSWAANTLDGPAHHHGAQSGRVDVRPEKAMEC